MNDPADWVRRVAPATALLCTACAENEPKYPSLMCGPCFAHLRRDIAVLVGAHTWLGVVMLTPAPAFRPGTRHAAGGSRIPFPAQLHDARVDIAGKLTAWARVVLEEHVPVLAHGPADADPATVGRWLLEHQHWISDQPWCGEMARELGDTARATYALAPWHRHRRDMPLPCPGCGFLTLTLYSGNELILCRWSECGRTLTTAEYWTEVRKQQQEDSQPEVKPSTSTGAAA